MCIDIDATKSVLVRWLDYQHAEKLTTSWLLREAFQLKKNSGGTKVYVIEIFNF